MQNKPQMVEAVMFFNEQRGICKEMFFPEFEALLDGVCTALGLPRAKVRAASTTARW